MTNASDTFTPPPNCWRSIGTWGDASCPILPKEVHCHNCPTYIQSGRHQLEQPATPDYRRQWTEIISHPKETEPTNTKSVAVFRLGNRRLALPSTSFKRVLDPQPIHHIPHRTNEVFLGLTPVHGELQLAFSLPALIGLQDEPTADTGRKRILPRMILIAQEDQRWVFAADEVYGLYRVAPEDCITLPPDDSAPGPGYLTSLFEVEGLVVNLIDDSLLFAGLRRQLQ